MPGLMTKSFLGELSVFALLRERISDWCRDQCHHGDWAACHSWHASLNV